MGKGAKESTQEVKTDLPEFIKPYVTRMMNRAESASRIPYYRYPGERLASLTPTTQRGLDMIRGLGGMAAAPEREKYVDVPYVDIPEEFKTPAGPSPDELAELRAQIAALQKANAARKVTAKRDFYERGGENNGERSSQPSGGVGGVGTWADGGIVTANFPELDQASDTASGLSQFQSSPITTGSFDDAAAEKYMNPYVSQVLDRLEGRTRDRYATDLRDINNQATAAGAFGGSRAALAGQARQNELFQELGDVEAEQLAAAYDRAGSMFTADQSRQLEADMASENARQGAAGIQARGGEGLAGIESLRQGLTLDRADALTRVGQLEQQETQRAADIAYEEFFRERGYDADQARYLATILGSVNYTPNTSGTSTTPGPNPFSSVLGLGLAGLGTVFGGPMGGAAGAAAGTAIGGAVG